MDIKNMLWGSVVGDALGVPYELKSRDEMSENPCVDMIGHGSHDLPVGSWSDDTSMMLALSDSIISKGKFEKFTMARNMWEWYNKGVYTPYGKCFGTGGTTRKAMANFQVGIPYEKVGSVLQEDNGNGALMRISPLTILLKDIPNLEDRFELVKKASMFTHNHNRSHYACFFFTEFLLNLYSSSDIHLAYVIACESLRKVLSKNDPEYKNFERILNGTILDVESKDIQSSPYVLHTLEASLWTLFNTESYEQGVLKAVNLGGDTDTTACIVGTIWGLLGSDIPKEWLDKIVKKDYLETYINGISNFSK